MKLISWNVNGIRSLRKDVYTTITELEADIACFQETKISSKWYITEILMQLLALDDGCCFNSCHEIKRNLTR